MNNLSTLALVCLAAFSDHDKTAMLKKQSILNDGSWLDSATWGAFFTGGIATIGYGIQLSDECISKGAVPSNDCQNLLYGLYTSILITFTTGIRQIIAKNGASNKIIILYFISLIISLVVILGRTLVRTKS